MRELKQLVEDTLQYLIIRPKGPVYLSMEQIKKLSECDYIWPFRKCENGFIFIATDGRKIEVKQIKINNG